MATVQPKEQFNLDGTQEQGFLSFFRSLPPTEGAASVRVFDRGDYYTVHGACARLAAAMLFHTTTVIKKLGAGDNKVDSVVLSRLNFESFVRELLLVKQYRVTVYKQTTGGSKSDWQEEYKASPGHLGELEDVVFGVGEAAAATATGIMAIKLAADGAAKVVGVGFVDCSGRLMQLCQFTDNDTFSNLEALIVQLGPKECLLPNGEGKSKLAQMVRRSGLLITERKRSEFSSGDTAQDLSRLVRGWGNSTTLAGRPELQRTHAVSALNALIKYLELTSDEGNFNQFRCKLYELNQYLRLDAAALKALHVEAGDVGVQHQQNGTILAVLDKCRTAAGHRLMAQWLRQPLTDNNRIEERHDLVSVLVDNADMRSGISDTLRRVPDLPRILRRLARKQANLQDCHRLYQCSEGLPGLCEVVGSYNGPYTATVTAVFTTPLQESINDLSKFQEMIETTVDMDQAKLGQYVVKPDFDDELMTIRDQLDRLTDRLQSELRRVASDLGLDAGKSVKLESNSQHGYFYRITLKEEKVLRNNRAYTILDTNKGGVRFRNASLTSLNQQHAESLRGYEKQQQGVVQEILNIACGYAEVVQSLSDVLATLDCLCSFASAAVSAPVPYVRPTMLPSTTNTLELVQCRHPCLELQDSVSYIPNDCNMGEDGGKFHILTGPNMGGKSTYLRSVAVAVLMAQVGSFVPCTSARISTIDAILARVGAGDCQQKGVSTFMAEMLETASILKTATANSLIIIDELGRGTSTYDGFGLAWAISEHIAQSLLSYCVFATHFHELTALEEQIPSVRNYHVAATTEHDTLTLLYQVLPGPCDRSFGIHCAKIAHFPDQVIEYAKRKAAELEDDFGGDDDSDEAVKRRRQQKKEGEELVIRTLEAAGTLNVEALTDDEVDAAVEKLRVEVMAANNPYITHLLSVA